MTIEIRVHTERFAKQALATEKDFRQIGAKTINRVLLDIRDAEIVEIRRAFDFAGSGTRSFLSGPGAFYRVFANENTLRGSLVVKPLTETILLDHVDATTITEREGDRLGLGSQLAVPIEENIQRTAAGKVRTPKKPGALLGKQIAGKTRSGKTRAQPRARGFVVDKGSFSVLIADFAPLGRTRKKVGKRAKPQAGRQDRKAAYILIDQGKLPSQSKQSKIHYAPIAIAEARVKMPQKFAQEVKRHRFRGTRYRGGA